MKYASDGIGIAGYLEIVLLHMRLQYNKSLFRLFSVESSVEKKKEKKRLNTNIGQSDEWPCLSKFIDFVISLF